MNCILHWLCSNFVLLLYFNFTQIDLLGWKAETPYQNVFYKYKNEILFVLKRHHVYIHRLLYCTSAVALSQSWACWAMLYTELLSTPGYLVFWAFAYTELFCSLSSRATHCVRALLVLWCWVACSAKPILGSVTREEAARAPILGACTPLIFTLYSAHCKVTFLAICVHWY